VVVIKFLAKGASGFAKEDGFKPSNHATLAFFREQLRFGHKVSFFSDI
jgi:hypothetical protein